jgi:hypothetical protein
MARLSMLAQTGHRCCLGRLLGRRQALAPAEPSIAGVFVPDQLGIAAINPSIPISAILLLILDTTAFSANSMLTLGKPRVKK